MQKKNDRRPNTRTKLFVNNHLCKQMIPIHDFRPETESDKQKELELKRELNLSHPHKTVKHQLRAVDFISRESTKKKDPTQNRPLPVPSNTAFSFNEWQKKRELKRKLNMATTCLNMRTSFSMQKMDNSRLYECKMKKK